MRLILCEKPSQARDIGTAILTGKTEKGEGFISSGDTVITWAFGHLMELDSPEKYNPNWKNWNYASLPIAPPVYKYSCSKDKAKHFKIVIGLIKKADEIIIATDADREGEMIARELLDFAKYKKVLKRLWLSALDENSIKNGFKNIKSGKETENLYHSARSRSIADWNVGINLTRAVTLKRGKKGEVLNIGRVQTPTFSLVVRRDREIENFKSQIFYFFEAGLKADGKNVTLKYNPKEKKVFDKEKANGIVAEITGQTGPVKVEENNKKRAAPPLFSLSLLQKEMNKSFGWSAQKTLDLLQELYEKDKLTTYPRSDCNFLPEEQIKDIPVLIENYLHFFPMQKEKLSDIDSLAKGGRHNYNTSKITAHHAIIPTLIKAELGKLAEEKANLYEVIYDRFICSLFPDFEYFEKNISFTGKSMGEEIIFSNKGITPLVQGWKAFVSVVEKEEGEGDILPDIKNDSQGEIVFVDMKEGKTSAPSYYTEGTLIADMEKISKFVNDESLKKILKETAGLGTEATRAGIIAKLKKDMFLEDRKKNIVSTEKSNRLFDILDEVLPDIMEPEKTALWEQNLEAIATGSMKSTGFIMDIESNVSLYIKKIGKLEVSKEMQENELNPTGIMSFHSDHLNEEITQNVKKWVVPGYGNVQKIIAGRLFSIEEIRLIILGEMTGPFSFTGSKGNFDASLKYMGQDNKYDSPKFDFVFEGQKSGEKTGIKTPYGEIIDNGDYVSCDKISGRIYKSTFGKELTVPEIAEIIASKNDGVKHTLYSKKKGSNYDAYIYFDHKAKPYPKMSMKFE